MWYGGFPEQWILVTLIANWVFIIWLTTAAWEKFSRSSISTSLIAKHSQGRLGYCEIGIGCGQSYTVCRRCEATVEGMADVVHGRRVSGWIVSTFVIGASPTQEWMHCAWLHTGFFTGRGKCWSVQQAHAHVTALTTCSSEILDAFKYRTAAIEVSMTS